MRISPMFLQAIRSNSTPARQAFQKTDCRKPHFAQNQRNDVDIFERLAVASFERNDIREELESMKLI